jgi:hypothetical protein
VILTLALLAAGPYDTLCLVTARSTAAAIVAREADVPLDKVMKVLDDITDPTAHRLMRASVLAIYSEPRVGEPFDEDEFISTTTAQCILRLERESPIPAGLPLNTDHTGVK